MCQESATLRTPVLSPLSYFFYTVSSAASTPFLPDVVVALLILIGTKITSIFPFSTVFCT